MHPSRHTLIDLETRFWQSMVDQDSDTAVGQMADQGSMVLTSFALSQVEVVCPNDNTAVLCDHVQQGVAPRGSQASVDQHMVDSSTWVKTGDQWACVVHTETPVQERQAA